MLKNTLKEKHVLKNIQKQKKRMCGEKRLKMRRSVKECSEV